MKPLLKSLRRKLSKPPSTADSMRQMARAESQLGNTARDNGDWASAIEHYGRSLQLDDTNQGLTVQYGHALKEAGQLDAAILAYGRALSLDPRDADAHLSLGHAFKLSGQQDKAIDAYARAIELDHNLTNARDEIIALGARDRLPSQITGKSAASQNLAQLHHLLQQGLEAAERLTALSTYPIENYDQFRRDFPIQPPPPTLEQPIEFNIWLEASTAHAHEVRASLLSLLDQSHTNWQASIRVSSDLAQHPVASLTLEDRRLHFCTDFNKALSTPSPILLMDAGTLLEAEALSWLSFAAKRTKADLIYTDHDYYESHWQYGQIHRDPVLQPMFDPDDMATTAWVPPLLLVQGRALEPLTAKEASSRELRRALLVTADEPLRRAHLPRLLASCPDGAQTSCDLQEQQAPVQATRQNSILVVIPTRDEADILTTCIDSLRACANHPERLNILVMDNHSSVESRALFSNLESEGKARFIKCEEPFNWSRINNQALFQTPDNRSDIIVFANNDIEALSTGWDDVLDQLFTDTSIGLVGARLLYPTGEIQHGGILLGGYNNRPVHDGLRSQPWAGGPLDRLQRQRGVAAVTGAFMAVKTTLFEQISGFDPYLAVAYNDVDFCLKVRKSGYRVVYAPSIQLTHYESLSRGTNIAPERISWDDSELASLHARWGEWLFFDPTRNPQWTSRLDHPFDGLRDLRISQIIHSLDLSARTKPWTVDDLDQRVVR